jgi:hypothetical protein
MANRLIPSAHAPFSTSISFVSVVSAFIFCSFHFTSVNLPSFNVYHVLAFRISPSIFAD